MATDGSDEIFDFKCTACAKRNRQREAVKYCVECQGYCCQGCLEVHQDFPTLANHNLLDKANFKSVGSTNELPAIPTERCAVHETKIIDMYCQDHDDVGCTTCMTMEHRSCTSIRVISEVIDTIYQQKEVKQSLQKLKTLEVSKETLKERNDKQMQELQKSRKEAIQEIRQHRKVLEHVLADMEKESIQEVDYEFTKKETALIKQKKDIEREKDNIQKAICDLQHAEGNKAQEFVCSKIAYKQINGSKDSPDLLNDEQADVQLSYSINNDITSFLKQKKIFGSIAKYHYQQYAQRRSLYTVKAERKINVKVQGDEQTCHIFGSCLTEDNYVLLADYENKKIKCVDTTKAAVVDQCCLPSSPWDVCCTGKNEAAVGSVNKKIQFVSLLNPMKIVRQLKLNHVCFGIAFKDDKLFITDNGESLFIHTLSGDLLQTVSNCSGNELFLQNQLLTFSDRGDSVFVARDNNGLFSLNMQGKHIDTYKDKELSCITGVCSDYRGNIFLCDFSSGNIKQISQENMSEIGTVVGSSHGLSGMMSICFNHQQSTLIVTLLSDEIKLFDLK